MDISLFLFINLGLQNIVFDAAMPFITHKGYLFFIAIASPLFLTDWRKGLVVIALGVFGFIAADNCADIMKNLIALPRPCHEIEHVRLLVACRKSFSLPSNHAATSFAVASIVGYLYRKAAIPAFILAVLIAFSRIYIGVHYPADVLAGAVLGIIIAAAILFIYQLTSDRFNRRSRCPR